jgi:hypothetical protein
MKYACLDISRIDKQYKAGSSICATVDGEQCAVQLAAQKCGFGERKFLVCARCGRRTMRLYKKAGALFLCDKCAGINLYKPIQNGTKGGYIELAYRMERYATKQGIVFKYPFDYKQFLNDPRMKKPSFRKSILILQALENMRAQNIFFKTVYKQETIKAVLSGKHPLLSKKSLYEMQKWLWNF